MGFVGKIIEKRADSRDFSDLRRGLQAIFRCRALLVAYSLPAEVRHVTIQFRKSHTGDKIHANVSNVNLIQPLSGKLFRSAEPLQVAEKVPQIQIILIHSLGRMRFDRLMIREKIPQDFRRVFLIIHHLKRAARKWERSERGRRRKKRKNGLKPPFHSTKLCFC